MPLSDSSLLPMNDDEFLEGDEVILAVDDYEPAEVQLLQKFFHQHGLEILTAGSAQEFRKLFDKMSVALVLLDINLPDADGTQLISEIKEGSPNSAIVMLSAATDLHTALECLRNGADDYLTKPVQLNTFWETVRNVLERRRLQINNLHYQQQIEQANSRFQRLLPNSVPGLPQRSVSLDENKFLEDDEVILIVDDYQVIIVLLQDFLKQKGLKNLGVGSAQEFRQQFKNLPVALVLLDVNLPDIDGAKLIPEIKEDSPDTAIIMLSAATDLHTALECLRNGADDYLTKPVHLTTFWETTRNVLEKRRLRINNLRYQHQLEQANSRLQQLYAQNKIHHPLANGNPPQWASGWGQDSYGVWVEFTVVGEDGPFRQRMRWIPPGRFLMGSPEDEPGRWSVEGPQHQVTGSKGFWLFDTPVTQALWQAVMGDNPSEFKSPNRPVEPVSWNDCQNFLKEINQQMPGLNLSLPSEAQWEYACRASSTTALYTGTIKIHGNTAPALDPIAWYSQNSGSKTHPVAQKQPNDWGLYDMLGNVWEWVADPWHKDYQGAPRDGSIWDTEKPRVGRAFRGGSCRSRGRGCSSTSRGGYGPDDSQRNLGFRCARVQG